MDRRELLHAVLRGEKTDRIPCGFWNHFSPEYRTGKAAVQAHLDYYENVQPDMLKVMNEHTYRIEKPISSVSDWVGLSPLPFARTGYEEHIEEFRVIRKELPKDLPLFATIHGVLVSAYHATEAPGYFSNPDNLVSRHLREDPETVSKALQSVVVTLSELCRRLIEVGADGIYYAALGGEAHRFERTLFERYVKPLDAAVVDNVRDMGAISIMHICKENVVLPMYQGINADVFNWAIHDCKYKLADGRKIFPGRTLLGGYDDRSGVMVDGTPEEIEKRAAEIVAEAGRERLILGSDCTLPEDVDIRRIKAVMHAAANL